MNLKRATILAIWGICYFFVVRTAGAFIPTLFSAPYAGQSVQILSLLASVTFLLFYIYFYREYLQSGQTELKRASILAIIGSAVNVFLYVWKIFITIKGLFFSLYEISPFLYHKIGSQEFGFWGKLMALLVSLLILYFFLIFYKEIERKKQFEVRLSGIAGIVGSAISLLLYLFSFVFVIVIKLVAITPRLFWIFTLLVLPLSIIGFFAYLVFYINFYKNLNKN